jgi:two-component system, OmpR family, KDP operon response regulator KdpE
MTRIFVADAYPDLRAALRLLAQDLGMQVVGEAATWSAMLATAAQTRPDMLLVDWDLIPAAPGATLADLRATCPASVVIVLISGLDARRQAALAAGADDFLSKGETPDRVAARLRAAASRSRSG